ncbi:MAG TPA: ATP-binding protein [Chloroflexota bacterium]|nr:ATP-binding protein [Chloroflexota bacterium]
MSAAGQGHEDAPASGEQAAARSAPAAVPPAERPFPPGSAPCPAALTPARALAALHAIATATTRGPDPTAVVRLAVEVARECLGVDAAAICGWRPEAARLVCVASTDPSEVANGLTLELDAGPAALAFHWRRTMIVEGHGGTDGAALWPSAPPTQTLAAVPLLAGGGAAGVLVVRTHGAYYYEAEHTRFLHLLAALIAPANLASLPPGAALIAPDAAPGPRERAAAPAATAGQAGGERAADVDLAGERAWALCQAVTCGVVVTDEEGRIARSNEPAARLLGLDAAAPRGEPLEAVLTLAGEDGAALAPEQHPVARARRTGRAVRDCVVGYQRGDGAQRWLQLDAVPVDNAGEPTARLVVSFVDVTVRREAERQLQAYAHTEKLRALGQMASGVAHDLNQYLGLVAGHGELALRALGRDQPDWASVQEAVQVMAQAALDGAETVKRLLAFVRPRQDGPRQRLAVGDVLREVARLTAPRWRDAAQAQGRRISLHVEADPDATVEGWPECLRELFISLVFNAVDALPHGGTIRLAAWRRGPLTHVEVADSGIGISPEIQPRVFEPFFSTKGERGTGLGLAVARDIVERHGGQVTLESAPGRGTTFRLAFPWAGGGPAAAPAGVAPEGARPLHVLVVDDEAMLGRMAARMLAVDGHTAVVVTSGEEALRRMCAESFDLVISDVGMGEGMNGWDLAHRVRAEFPDVRFALATGWGAQIEPDEARARGVGAVIGKPYRLQDLRYLLSAA